MPLAPSNTSSWWVGGAFVEHLGVVETRKKIQQKNTRKNTHGGKKCATRKYKLRRSVNSYFAGTTDVVSASSSSALLGLAAWGLCLGCARLLVEVIIAAVSSSVAGCVILDKKYKKKSLAKTCHFHSENKQQQQRIQPCIAVLFTFASSLGMPSLETLVGSWQSARHARACTAGALVQYIVLYSSIILTPGIIDTRKKYFVILLDHT